MKRTVITNLLKSHTAAETTGLIEQIFSAASGSEKTIGAAKLILAESARKSRHEKLDATGFYESIIKSSPDEFALFLDGTEAASLGKAVTTRARTLLADLLMSRAGRKKTSDLSRNQQLAAAQVRRREKEKQEGKKQLNVWISTEAVTYIDSIKVTHACVSQAEALELVLDAAIKGISL